VKLKLDENLGKQCAVLLRSAGHDVTTVVEEDVCSAPDGTVIEACRAEGRCLVTLDLDFGNPLLFRPSEYSGIALLRLPPKPTPRDLAWAVTTLAGGLARDSIRGKLWVIQSGRLRVYQEESADLD